MKRFRNRKKNSEIHINLKEADLTFDKDGKMRRDRIMHNTANTSLFTKYTWQWIEQAFTLKCF